jgi:hypothetical protein
VTPLDNVVGMQQNMANPARCVVKINKEIKSCSYKGMSYHIAT